MAKPTAMLIQNIHGRYIKLTILEEYFCQRWPEELANITVNVGLPHALALNIR